mgnify:CR=1 FL=1
MKYTEEEVAEILYEATNEDYACNINGNDEWLPYVCEYANSAECPSGKECWLQYVKHRHKREVKQ